MSGIALPMVLKRMAWFSARMQRISIDHFPENRDTMFRIGQASMSENFFRFSCAIIAIMVLIFNFTNLIVSI